MAIPFKTKPLCAALLTGMTALGAAGTAQAVYLSPDGAGQLLIYPYTPCGLLSPPPPT